LLYDCIGNVLVIITSIYSGDGNLDQFIDVGGLCDVGRFCNAGVFGCNGGRGG
jgi:hypothetical protein